MRHRTGAGHEVLPKLRGEELIRCVVLFDHAVPKYPLNQINHIV